MKDYYAILGVARSASELEIKRAFRKLAVRYHPDKNQSADAKPRFQEINEAYDVIGDVNRRARYDELLLNPFSVFTETVPHHRDPAYRPQPRRAREPSASYILMRDSLKYVLWISRVGLLVTTLFFIDFFIPYQDKEDTIEGLYSVRTRRGGQIYHVILTGSGKEIKVYDFDSSRFRESRTIRVAVTAIYGSIISLSNASGTYKAWVAYLYSTLLFFPIILFVNSLLALIFRKRVEFCFNLNVTAFILLIINVILI